MDPDSEREVSVLLPVDDDGVGLLEGFRVAVGRREVEQHAVADAHRAPGEIDLGADLACHRDGGVGAEELLDRDRHQLRFGYEASPIIGVRRQMPQ